MDYQKKILVTGGAGFIGSELLRFMVPKYPQYYFVNLDVLSYAGNLENLKSIESAPNYTFVKGDIQDAQTVMELLQKHEIDHIIHTAAESHVDRSIADPLAFVRTNVMGTCTLLHAAKQYWGSDMDAKLFYHVSTDEVYGSLGAEGFFTEQTPYDPHSPYSASKASSDHFVRAFGDTYAMPVVISNCSNNYGPYQFPEKLIPLMINNIQQQKELPVYGQGTNVRDWLYVADHVDAMDAILHRGRVGETYNVGGQNEWTNILLVEKLCDLMDEKLGREKGSSRSLITFVKDRAGHDHRYAIDIQKIEYELGWSPKHDFETGLSETIDWYLQNPEWVQNILSGEYQDYYERQYKDRV